MPDLTIQLEQTVAFLVNLLNIPSPTGFTGEAVAFTENALRALPLPPGATLSRTRKGALLLHLPGKTAAKPVGLTAHVDTLGLMVAEIKGNGRLRCSALGGVMWPGTEFEGVLVRTQDDRRIRGCVVPLNASVHVNRGIHTAERSASTMEIRLDERTTSAAATRALGIEVGDFAFLDPRVETGPAGFIRSRFLDDKLCVAAIYGALAALNGQPPAQDTDILISNYEEAGHGGAPDWRPDLHELLVVDMAAVGDGQNSDEFHCTVCVKDASGPYHIETIDHLRRLAATHDISVKTDIYPFYSSDGSAYWRAGGGARVGLVGPGVDASHSYERSHQDALRDTVRLLAAYLLEPAV